MSFEIHETSIRNISTTRDERNRTSVKINRTFNLVSLNPSTVYQARIALNNFGVASGARHPENQFYFCDNITVDQKSPIFFEANAEYNSPRFSESGDGNPLLEPAVVAYSGSSSSEPIDTDVFGSPIENTVKDPYIGINRRFGDLVISIQKNYAVFPPAAFYVYINKTNADNFLGFPAGTLLIDDITASPVNQQDFFYWQVGIKILVRIPPADIAPPSLAWALRLKNEGLNRITFEIDKLGNLIPDQNDPTGYKTKKVRCIDENGDFAGNPKQLNQNGFQAKKEDPPFWNFFIIYEPIAYSGMNIF